MNPINVDLQITFSRTPASNEAARQEIAEQTKVFEAQGGRIRHIPFGVSAVNNDDFRYQYHPREVSA